jgi:outer membrane protein OmpA-like peptidoglycan-associated protein
MKRYLYTLILTMTFACVMAQDQEPPTVFDVMVKNETRINTDQLEFSPTFFEDGILFISSRENIFKFVDRRMNKSTMGIFQASRDGEGQLGDPVFFSNRINTKYHEGPLCLDMTGSDMYFTRSNYVNGKLGKSQDGWVNLKVLKASRKGDGWDNIRDLPFNSNDFSTCHPSISPNGDRLYFASDRPGGFGGLDIYYVEKMGDDYGDPVNLGPEVNTDKDEIFPFIHADGTLFFCSNGREGLGGLDIYYTRQLPSASWREARNLGTPFNSSKDDFGFILDLETKNGYFSSNRPGGQGQDDIYSFYVPEGLNKLLADRDLADALKPMPFRVFVADNATGNELRGALVSFLDLEDLNLSNVLTITDENGNLIRIQSEDPESNELTLRVDMANMEIKGYTDREGMFETKLPASTYVVSVNAPNYFPRQVVIDKDPNLEEILILLDPLGDVVPFSGVVLDPRYNTPIAGAKVTVRDKESGEIITILYTDRNGQFNSYLPRDRDYVIEIEKDNLKATREVSTRNLKEGAEIAMAFDITDPKGRNPFAAGNIIKLPNIYYNFNDASIRPDAKPDLDALATILKQFPNLQIELASHTDSRGSDAYNKNLSQRRAESAQRYLSNKGVARKRMKAVGYGEIQLKNHCSDGVECSEEEHQVNRRTEFRILGDPEVSVTYLDNAPSTVNGKVGVSSPGVTPSDSPVRSAGPVPATEETGSFQVVAGTFKVAANAERRVDELKGFGFNEARIVQTPAGMSAVLVGQYDSRTDAQAMVTQLESGHKIGAYIKRQ